jgi:DeoR/GlpR family transcriptional regulator of sugar metabolism
MYSEERKQKILELIQLNGSMSTSELAKMVGASPLTLRKDLAVLESRGLVKRTHGGAISRGLDSRMELSFFEKSKFNLEEKVRIAYRASEMIQVGDSIILDAGTTTLQIAKHIKDKIDIHILTNSVYNLLELAESPGIEVSLTGGSLRKISRSLIGPLAISSFSNVHAGKLFLGATGVSLEKGLTSPNMIEAQTKSAMIRAADTVILVVDHSKFGKTALGKFGELEEVQILITDKQVPSEIIEAVIQKGIEVIQV